MMITEQRLADGDGFHSLALLADKASSLLQAVASPSIVQLVMRLALAVPFWRSGVLKWAGFGKLSDTAVTLFTDEFTFLEGPTIFPAPSVMAFLSGTGEILFPVLLVLGLGTRVAALAVVHDADCRAYRSRRLANPFTWVAMALGIIAPGPGRISMDHLVRGILRLPESV